MKKVIFFYKKRKNVILKQKKSIEKEYNMEIKKTSNTFPSGSSEVISFTGIGKRKTSVAKVFLTEGSGKIQINKKSLEDFFSGMNEETESINNPFVVVNLVNLYDIDVDVKGGGMNSQLDSIKLGIAKAICQMKNEYRQVLKQHMLLRRDSRIKERRKYGLKKARKASQYSKR